MSTTPGSPAANSWPEKASPAEIYRSLPELGPLFVTWWPEPDAARRWVAVAAGGVGLLAALLIPGAPRPGINLVICGLAVALPVWMLAYARGRAKSRRWPVGRVQVALATVALGLTTVAAVRASEWLAWSCVGAALCLGAAAALDVRRWVGVLITVPLFGIAVLRALPWAGRAVRFVGYRGVSRPWLRGIGIGVTCTIVVAALLASADAAFGDLVSDLLSVFQPVVELDMLPARALTFLAVAGIVLGGLFAVSTQFAPGTALTKSTAAKPVARHPAEWLTPLVLVAVTIAAFLAVEATMLFGGAEVVVESETVSHAERAHQGFGQLTVVTLIVLVLLAWSGRAAAAGPPAHRWLMGFGGGTVLVLALLLGTSALRRLWLYQDVYGWTVTRLNAGAFEIWIATVLVGVAVGWVLRRPDLLPRFLIGSAALGLLAMGLAGPDALVAAANVERFEHTKSIDTDYLSRLSADAVPALNRLPEPLRSCALAGQSIANDPWFGWNFARSRADRLLRSQPTAESVRDGDRELYRIVASC
ncbi:MAG TPA: DUF4173 domain-containing protein [Kineosporiaceae bacterium]|nr:DUF4173 domain-containing protein [Kineosporiaceae bacterium]